MSLKDQIDKNNIPAHVAIIMDGNGRWAKAKGKNRVFGHKSGVKSVREATEGCAEIGVKFLTLYAFSTENWNRPQIEVFALMELLVNTISNEVKKLMENNIRLLCIGDTDKLPKRCRVNLEKAIKTTSNNTHMTLVLALSYSSRWEITTAMQLIAEKVEKGLIAAADINEEMIKAHLNTSEIPDPELLIRTSGEFRISNFLLWQIAYSELYFTNTLWPDFNREELFKAILEYQRRERRFGLISEQIKA